MNLWTKVSSRLQTLFRRSAVEAEMSAEMAAHLEMQAERYRATGMSPEEASFAARRNFGGVDQIKEQARDQRGWVWLEQWGKDASFAVRSLARAHNFSLAVLGTLVVGIGVATVVFELTASIVIFSQPYPQPEQLFVLGFKNKQSSSNAYRSAIQLQAYQEQVNAFSEYAAVTRDLCNVVVNGEPVLASLVSASVDCFRTLGIKPVLGRGFLPEEYRAGADNVVIITDLFWRRHFNASPDVLGQKVLIDQQVCTVIGVLKIAQPFPSAFRGDVFRPLILKVDPASPLAPAVFVIGRLRPGVSTEQARAALAAVELPQLPNWAVAYLADQEPALIKLSELGRPETYWVMLIAAALLYAIACLNAMNLMLVRLLGRRRELSIRLALGGSRWRIVRLLMIESMGLALAASLVVTLAARWLFPPLIALVNGSEAARYFSFWDWRTLGCIAALSVLACMAVVLAPAWRLFKVDLNTTLKEGGAALGESRRMARLRSALVVLQAALAVILLAGTGLMVRSFDKLQRVDLGFAPNGIVRVFIAFPKGYDLKPEPRLQLFERLQQRLATIPGVRGVSFGQNSLLIGYFQGLNQLQMSDGTYQAIAGSCVGADFQKTAGLTLKRGRWLSDKRGDFEVVINETLARTRFGDEDPIGRSIKLLGSGDEGYPVVGVVRDVRETVRSPAGMRTYYPNWTKPTYINSLVLRLDQDPGKEFAGVVRRAIYAFDPKLIASNVSSINDLVGYSMWAERYAFRILKGLSAIALVLAVVGLFSVLVYSVNSRMKEFGVRLALGATPEDLHRLVLTRGLATATIGIIAGTAAALGLTRFMQSLLFETTPYDPLVYVGVGAVMLAAAALACWLPARRATKVNPVEALRAE
jgi:putative ABC transport system permease protein